MRHCILLAILVGGCGGDANEPCPTAQPETGDHCSFAGTCYYSDACTGDPAGVTALCTSGTVELGVDLVIARCPVDAPRPGTACLCGGRQHSPCSYDCTQGGVLTATCDPVTKVWSATAPSACTPEQRPDGGI